MASSPSTPTSPRAANGNNIKVFCRFRPQNSSEENGGGQNVVHIDETLTSCRVESKEFSGQFSFDRIFDWKLQVFEQFGAEIVDQVFDGFNSTLFCYGQTGSGKTHTMMGLREDTNLAGIIPRLVSYLFKKINMSSSNIEFTVRVAFMEIYMERIRDLLNPLMDNLPIHEEKSKGVFIKGLKEVYVASENEVFDLLRIGDQSRSVASTNMNEQSSRSHSIFVLTINQKNTETGNNKCGKLYLVDLAGSEKVGKTGATGQTLEEAKKINKSLTALGMVINALTDGKSSHVPYRDSKLTRILQESLGGNSKTTLVINCSPSSLNDSETVSTLRFGVRAKSIKNSAVVNIELSAEELKTALKKANMQLRSLQSYLAALEAELAIWRSGEKVPVDKQVLDKSRISSTVIKDSPSAVESSPTLVTSPDEKQSTGSINVIAEDEREEYLRRENELMDQLAEKECELEQLQKIIESLETELNDIKQREQSVTQKHTESLSKCVSLELQVEQLQLQNDDNTLTIDNLKESNERAKERIVELEGLLAEEERRNHSLKQHETENRAERISEMMQGLLAKTPLPNGQKNDDTQRPEDKQPEQVLLADSNKRESQSSFQSLNFDLEAIRVALEQEKTDHQTTKKKYMEDLQDRCAKVVELELRLDEMGELNDRLLKESKQKKMEILERNLDQLSKVQKKLVDQNLQLKKNLETSEKKVLNRNERIVDLEKMLQALNEKLAYSEEQHLIEISMLRRRVEVLQSENGKLTTTALENRIAKPLRGGA